MRERGGKRDEPMAAGLMTISGFEAFRHMVVGSFEAYTGIRPDAERTSAKLAALKPN